MPLNDTTAKEASKANKKPVRRRSSSKARSDDGAAKPKPKKAASKAAKPKPVAEKLLSPSSAAFRVSRQDVLFGTSSQLAREDSPTMVREIQRAIRESEHDADARDFGESLAVAPWPRLQRIEGRRALWRASSRDDDGGMLDRQSVYLPEPDRTQDIPLLMDATQVVDESDDDGFVDIDRIHALPEPQSQDGFLDIDDVHAPAKMAMNAPVTISSDLPTPPPTIPEDNSAIADTEPDSPPFHDIDDFPRDHGLPPSGQNQEANSSFFDIDDFAPSTQPPISAGSPTKKRRGRPPLSQSAIPSNPPAAPRPLQAPASAPPRAPRTPRRPSDRFIDIDEILDSEDDHALSPTPPRLRPHITSPPLPLTFSPSTTALPKSKSKSKSKPSPSSPPSITLLPPSHLLFDTLRPTLFAGITALVRALPRSEGLDKEGQAPNWHEKMLLYDPIVVEEFTAWLVGRGVHVWRRARAGEVKKWKDAGGEREGEGGGGEEVEEEERVYMVPKDVEAWMVKGWCEESGVCAVSCERRGKGGARRGVY